MQRTMVSVFSLSITLALSSTALAHRIASRGAMTCVVRPSGSVVCWGSFVSQRGEPSPPAERTRNATAVTVGLNRACALTAAGAVECWGSDGVARPVAGLAGVQELVGGAGPMCARLADGSVRCADATRESLAFSAVNGVSRATKIVAGESHACARIADGTVRCWGASTYNQLGEGRYDSRASAVTARLLGRVSDLAAGDDFTCGTASDGRVVCVGYRFDAEGSPRSRTTWAPRVLPRAEALFAGGTMVCATQRGRPAQCAGFNDVIAMGPGEYALSYPDGTLAQSTDAEELAIAKRSVCIRTAAGAVRCIGDDSRGALAGASGPSSRAPVRVSDVEGATRLVAAGNHTCAIVANGTVKCWGFDDPQDLFATSGERTGVLGRRPSPVALPGVTGATDVVTNGATTVVRLGDGSLVMWGAGPFEPMGRVDGAGVDRVVRFAAAPQRAQYALGIQHLCAVTREGGVECAGSGQYGQWGAGREIPSMNGDSWFRRSFDAVSALSGVSSIASHWHTLCAIGRDASLRCWGQNASLLLGAQSPGGAIAGAVLAAPREVEQVVLGGIHSRLFACVRRRGGAVGCWGANEYWQTGASGPRDRAEENQVIQRGAVSIAAGTHHACAATSNGAVSCWGANERGQTGPGGSATPHEVSAVRDAVELAAGRSHTCARTRDGAVWCWGASADGALGDGGSSYVRELVNVSLPQ